MHTDPDYSNYSFSEPSLDCKLTIRQGGTLVDDVATGLMGDDVSLTCDARCKGPGATPALVWYKQPDQKAIRSTRGRYVYVMFSGGQV